MNYMNQIFWIVALSFFVSNATLAQETEEAQQEIRTLFDNDKKTTLGGFGTPIFGIGHFDNQWSSVIGGKGGVIINRKLALGLVGMGKTGSNSIKDPSNNFDNLHFSYGAGGLFVEYLMGATNPIHLSFPINLMAGHTEVKQKMNHANDIGIESSSLYVIEPGINVEFNVSRYFVPSLQVSYRKIILNKELEILNESDLSGAYIGLNFKFGKF